MNKSGSLFLITLLLISILFTSIVSAQKVTGSFTITAKAVEESEQQNQINNSLNNSLNPIKNQGQDNDNPLAYLFKNILKKISNFFKK